MIIYIEKKQSENPHAKKIVSQFVGATVLEVDNFKNIFDTSQVGSIEKSIIIAGVNESIIEAPIFYGYTGKGFFLKNSLNCVYNCQYCYLQGIFKSDINVFFVNFKDVKKDIINTLNKNKRKETIWFYSSDYSDNLATDSITGFTKEFIPFFGGLQNAKMEIRTKSANIAGLLDLQPNNHIEIAFSLSPQQVIDEYEKGTPSLTERLQAISSLLDAGWQVGVRFMPLIGMKGYKEIYEDFLAEVTQTISVSRLYSIFIGGLLFTEHDYKVLQKKQSSMKLLYDMHLENDGFYRQDREVRDRLYKKFSDFIVDKKVRVCFDTF